MHSNTIHIVNMQPMMSWPLYSIRPLHSKPDAPILHIVTNPSALTHFVQFLDTRPDGGAALALLKFWLDADSFRAAAAAEPLISSRRSSALSKSISLDDTALRRPSAHESSARRPLTDDEKSHARRTERRRFQTTLATDAVRIFRKYLSGRAAHPVEVPATVLARISLALGAVDADDGDDRSVCGPGEPIDECRRDIDGGPDDDCGKTTGKGTRDPRLSEPTAAGTASAPLATIFAAAQRHAIAALEHGHLDAFVESAFYARHCIDVLTGDQLHIADILHCQSALFYLAEFLEQDGRRQVLEFWMAAVHFR